MLLAQLDGFVFAQMFHRDVEELSVEVWRSRSEVNDGKRDRRVDIIWASRIARA